MAYEVPEDTTLIVVDVQNDFCPGGKLAVAGGDEIVPLVNDLTKKFNFVVFTQDWHPEGHKSFASAHPGKSPFETVEMPYGTQVLWPDHCVQDTDGADFRDDLDIPEAAGILQKGANKDVDSYSGFFENDRKTQPLFEDNDPRSTLADTLRENGIKRVVLVGLAFDYCVGWHGLDARKEGFDVVVVKDATRSIAPDSEAAMTKQLQEAGVQIVQSSQLESALKAPRLTV